jgi:hypothetical protein
VSGQPQQAQGVVKVRLSGDDGDVDVLEEVLSRSPTVEIIDRSGRRRNRYDPGNRMYLTVRVHPEAQR